MIAQNEKKVHGTTKSEPKIKLFYFLAIPLLTALFTWAFPR